jgi:hypothetical protein
VAPPGLGVTPPIPHEEASVLAIDDLELDRADYAAKLSQVADDVPDLELNHADHVAKLSQVVDDGKATDIFGKGSTEAASRPPQSAPAVTQPHREEIFGQTSPGIPETYPTVTKPHTGTLEAQTTWVAEAPPSQGVSAEQDLVEASAAPQAAGVEEPCRSSQEEGEFSCEDGASVDDHIEEPQSEESSSFSKEDVLPCCISPNQMLEEVDAVPPTEQQPPSPSPLSPTVQEFIMLATQAKDQVWVLAHSFTNASKTQLRQKEARTKAEWQMKNAFKELPEHHDDAEKIKHTAADVAKECHLEEECLEAEFARIWDEEDTLQCVAHARLKAANDHYEQAMAKVSTVLSKALKEFQNGGTQSAVATTPTDLVQLLETKNTLLHELAEIKTATFQAQLVQMKSDVAFGTAERLSLPQQCLAVLQTQADAAKVEACNLQRSVRYTEKQLKQHDEKLLKARKASEDVGAAKVPPYENALRTCEAVKQEMQAAHQQVKTVYESSRFRKRQSYAMVLAQKRRRLAADSDLQEKTEDLQGLSSSEKAKLVANAERLLETFEMADNAQNILRTEVLQCYGAADEKEAESVVKAQHGMFDKKLCAAYPGRSKQ